MADINFVPTLAGFLFLAVVLDAWSRRIMGWAFAADLKTRVVLDALDMAIAARKPESVIHHSDQGSQYTSLAFGSRCKDADVRPSTGSVGDAYDNAMCESFFATLEFLLLDRHRFRSHCEARMAVFHFIEGLCNPSRHHSALGKLSPIEYERKHHDLTRPSREYSTEAGQLQNFTRSKARSAVAIWTSAAPRVTGGAIRSSPP